MTTTRKNIVLEKYARTGLYIRRITDGESELKILKKNAAIIRSLGITSCADLKRSFFQDLEDDSMPELEDLRFRPATFVKQGIPIEVFQMDESFGLIIDPALVYPVFLYKKNVFSDKIGKNKKNYNFFRPYRRHDLKTQAALVDKMHELNYRRLGLIYDNYDGTFAKLKLPRTESLLYLPEIHEIIGLEVSSSTNIAKAYSFRTLLQEELQKNIYFYQYHIEQGEFTIIPEKLIQDCLKNKALIEDRLSPYPTFPDHYTYFLKGITSSLSREPLAKHPLTYEFTATSDLNKENKLRCKTYFKDGTPLIQDDQARLFCDKKGVIPKVAALYRLKKLKVCAQLLNDEKIMHHLGVSWIQLKSETVNRANGISEYKKILVLSFTPVSFVNFETLLEDIGYDPAQHWKWEQMKTSPTGAIKIRLSVLQSLDFIEQKLMALKESLAKEPAHKKYRKG